MKNIVSIIIFLFIACPSIIAQSTLSDLAADSSKLFVEYAQYDGYVNDSIYKSLVRGSLFIGEKAAFYYYQFRTPEEFIKSMRKKLGENGANDVEGLLESFKMQFDLERQVSVVYAKYYSSPGFLQLRKHGEQDVWLSDTISYAWTPMNEFKIISGYRCQKAIAKNSRGENVIVWFTEDIPYSVGPLDLSGLPGLIMEYYNPAVKRLFKSVAISSSTIPEQKFRKWLFYPVISKAESAELYNKEVKKASQFRRMIDAQNQ